MLSRASCLHRHTAAGLARLHTSVVAREEFRLKDLQAKFLDPKSPFYLAPGEVGPASPDDHTVARPLQGQEHHARDWTPPPPPERDTTPVPPHMSREYDRQRATAHEWFDSNGFDPQGRLEWPCAWGESDMYQHINNVSYCRYIESARMRWATTLLPDLGDIGQDFINGRHTGFVLKEFTIKYRWPCTWPDSLIIATKPHSVSQERGQFKLATAMWSLKDNKLAVTADATCTVYDFDNLKKGKMPDLVRDVLEKRAHAMGI